MMSKKTLVYAGVFLRGKRGLILSILTIRNKRKNVREICLKQQGFGKKLTFPGYLYMITVDFFINQHNLYGVHIPKNDGRTFIMRELLDLFWTFARVGGLTFGGGYAMLPILQREMVEKRQWVSDEELMDYYAIGQCTPGIIAVNTATFVGQKRKGIVGGIVATLGVVFPSLVIITIIAAFIQNFADLAVVKNAFAGIRVCVCVLILNAVIKLLKSSVIDKATLVIYVVVAVGSILTSLSPIVFVLLAAVAGILLQNWKGAVSK